MYIHKNFNVSENLDKIHRGRWFENEQGKTEFTTAKMLKTLVKQGFFGNSLSVLIRQRLEWLFICF